jgi:hypothetical protein
MGVLIRTDKGLFLARSAIGTVSVKRVYEADIGYIYAIQNLASAGVLIAGENGLFLAGSANGLVTVKPVGKNDTGYVSAMHDLPGAGVLLKAANGLFLARSANGTVSVDLSAQRILESSTPYTISRGSGR